MKNEREREFEASENPMDPLRRRFIRNTATVAALAAAAPELLAQYAYGAAQQPKMPAAPLFTINRAQQLGFVVRDCEKTAEQIWRLFGVGPWEINVRDPNSTQDNQMIKNMTYHGKPARFGYKVAEAKLGPEGFAVEFIQPLDGESIYSEFLKKHGEGVNHIGWHIVESQEEFDKDASMLEAQGFPCDQSQRLFASHVGYFDTTSVLKTFLEVGFRDPKITRPGGREILHPDPSNKPIVNINKGQKVGLIVRDCEKTAEQIWRLFGVGPWDINVRDPNSTQDNQMIKNMILHGKPGRFSYKAAEAKLGPNGLIIELIQPTSEESIYAEFLKKPGEGVHHIGWHIVKTQEEFDRVKAAFEAQGFPCLQTQRVFASQLAYYDTTSVLKTSIVVSYQDPSKVRPAPTRVVKGW
jgi:methylmalonyl-CoA/ethylmalonyl-CoA epimerase